MEKSSFLLSRMKPIYVGKLNGILFHTQSFLSKNLQKLEAPSPIPNLSHSLLKIAPFEKTTQITRCSTNAIRLRRACIRNRALALACASATREFGARTLGRVKITRAEGRLTRIFTSLGRGATRAARKKATCRVISTTNFARIVTSLCGKSPTNDPVVYASRPARLCEFWDGFGGNL